MSHDHVEGGQAGGRGYYWERDGFTFDAGRPDHRSDFCRNVGTHRRDMTRRDARDVSPFYRLNWPDGTNFDYTNDDTLLRSEIAKLDPEDVAGSGRFLEYAAGVYEEGYLKLGHVAFLDFASMIKAAPALAKYQAWRSVYSMVSSFVKSDKLRQALSFHTLLVGGNPMNTSALYALIHKLERDGGVWFAMGGTNALIGAWSRTSADRRHVAARRPGRTLATRWATGRPGPPKAAGTPMPTWSPPMPTRPHLPHVAVGIAQRAAHRGQLENKKYSPSLFVVHSA